MVAARQKGARPIYCIHMAENLAVRYFGRLLELRHLVEFTLVV